MIKLTKNAIMYASVGFKQQAQLQILDVRHGSSSSFEMIVYDGNVYVGAYYNCAMTNKNKQKQTLVYGMKQDFSQQSILGQVNHEIVLERYDVIRTQIIQHHKSEPLQLRQLEIVKRGLTQILGKQVLALEQYMNKKKFANIFQVQDDYDFRKEPYKKVKLGSIEQNQRVIQPKIIEESVNNSQKPNDLQESKVHESVSLEANKQETSQNIPEIKPSGGILMTNPQIIDLICDSPPQQLLKKSVSSLVKLEKSSKKTDMMISDLYQRIIRFKILCRINSMSHFTSQKGNSCTKLMLIDEKGDEIYCFICQKGSSSEHQQSNKTNLLRGRSYIFENGQVEKDDQGYMSISISMGGITETKAILQSFHPNKMMRVGQLENISSHHYLEKAMSTQNKSINNKKKISKELNVCGIFKGLKEEPKLVNNQFRITGILCDPDHQKSINFSLYVDELATFPLSGTVLSLHNMHICENERTLRLDQSKRSYYIVQQNNSHKYFVDLVQQSRKQTWKQIQYANLSEVKYISRNIQQLKSLLSSMLEQDQCYSEIDCNIVNMKQKRQFLACGTCLHDIKAQKGTRTYCYHCKKIEKVVKRFIFNSQVADSTGSINVTIFSEQVQPFINATTQEYAQMNSEDRAALLQLSGYQNLILKIKSQKQLGGSSHLAVKAEKNCYRRGLEHIKEHSISSKTKYTPSWL